MPQRFLKPGITTSAKWNALTWFEQSFYIRILTLVDDYGRYDARPEILKAYCFPLRDDVTRQETAAASSRLQSTGMIEVYRVDGKEFLQLTNWTERVRNKSKWPDPVGCQKLPIAAERSQKLLPPSSPSPTPATTPTPSPSDNGEGVVEMVRKVTAAVKVESNGLLSPQSEIQRLLCKEYGRAENERWVYSEEYALKDIAVRPDAVQECRRIIAYRRNLTSDDRKKFSQSISSFLQNWSSNLDRARASASQQPRKIAPYKPPTGATKFEHGPDAAKKFRAAISTEANP